MEELLCCPAQTHFVRGFQLEASALQSLHALVVSFSNTQMGHMGKNVLPNCPLPYTKESLPLSHALPQLHTVLSDFHFSFLKEGKTGGSLNIFTILVRCLNTRR
uniref:Uncharacterized protein n=1 Tax=Trypanosoma congolense (strain IL3000) TaxID=1068625 RepID=G0V027_TRYCI|nr:hypothetical protein, unlikely [Trypanosoma congolense IL3000]